MTATKVTYGTTADGLIAATVGPMTYCMDKGRSEFYIASMHRQTPPEISTLTRSDFYGNIGNIPDVEAFHAEMEDIAVHMDEVKAFSRKEISSSTSTPWGKSQGATVFAENGIYFHETASHGGMKVYSKLNKQIPEPYRADNGWYEEDCEYSKVIVSLPQYFSQREIRQAITTVINWYPDEYEKVTGIEVLPGQSNVRDRKLFEQKHASDWIGISASSFENENGQRMVEVTASLGGERSRYENGKDIVVETKTFIVPSEEYSKGWRPFGFVIDEDRHPEKTTNAAVIPEASQEELDRLFGRR